MTENKIDYWRGLARPNPMQEVDDARGFLAGLKCFFLGHEWVFAKGLSTFRCKRCHGWAVHKRVEDGWL